MGVVMGKTMTSSLELDGFRFRAGSRAQEATLVLPAGEIGWIEGASGSGKTSLLRAVAGLEPRLSGRVSVKGRLWSDRFPTEERGVGFAFQHPVTLPGLTVREELEWVPHFGPRWNSVDPKAAVGEVLKTFELEALANRRSEALSGGELQRLGLARAVLSARNLLLLDEPVSALDPESRARIEARLQEHIQRSASGSGLVTLWVSHDALSSAALPIRRIRLGEDSRWSIAES